MVVDLEVCSKVRGCTACADACHAAHNVPRIANVRHDVKWIWKEPIHRILAVPDSRLLPARLQSSEALVFCNHCDDPPCVRVCPAGATWRRDDGIVMMDQHRCIGCRYCIAACPYGSRSFNWSDPREHLAGTLSDYPTRTKGVVEKCTFCVERIAEGRAPACVEACEANALVFGDANDPSAEVSRLVSERFSLRRREELGTRPQVHYLVGYR